MRLSSLNALDYRYLPDAPLPSNWLEFLSSLWPDDSQSIETLQEIFGYLLTHKTDQQKIFMLLGPPRSGKGTIIKVMVALLGKDNVCAPTLGGLATQFGLQQLIGKQAAIIGDARLGGNSADRAAIVERLLSISGEDPISIDRKYKSAWTGTLSTRFLIVSNELPQFIDVSAALPSRFIIPSLTESFLGREDLNLPKRLMKEIPAILNWAIEGWQRLEKRGHFVQPTSSTELIQNLEDLASPVRAFLRECCDVSPGNEVSIDALFIRWKDWCDLQGRKPGNKQSFGRAMHAVMPGLRTCQHDTERKIGERFYQGIGLNNS